MMIDVDKIEHEENESKNILGGINYFLYGNINRLKSEYKSNNKLIIISGFIALIGSGLIINSRNHSSFVSPGFDSEGLKTYAIELGAILIVYLITTIPNRCKLHWTLKDHKTISELYTKVGDLSDKDNRRVGRIIRKYKLDDITSRLKWNKFR